MAVVRWAIGRQAVETAARRRCPPSRHSGERWGLQTEWCNTAIVGLARFQYPADEYRQKSGAIRQCTDLEHETKSIGWSERHRCISLIRCGTELDVTARWNTSFENQEGAHDGRHPEPI